jgi:hypothetical protein
MFAIMVRPGRRAVAKRAGVRAETKESEKMGDPSGPASVDASVARYGCMLIDDSPAVRSGAATPVGVSPGIFAPAAVQSPVASAPGGTSAHGLWLMADVAETNIGALLGDFQAASRERDTTVAQIRASSLDEEFVRDQIAKVDERIGRLQRSAIDVADINLRAQQNLAAAVTDPVDAAHQGRHVADAESYVRQAHDDTPTGIAETAEIDLRAAIDEYQEAENNMRVLELEISQVSAVDERIRRGDELTEPSLKFADARDKVRAALDLNLARWDQANRAAEVANSDGSRAEVARIARDGYMRAQIELQAWTDSEKIGDPHLRAAVAAARKADGALEKAELEVSDRILDKDDLMGARDEFDRNRGGVNQALHEYKDRGNKALVAAQVANRDGKHEDALETAREELNRAKAEDLVRRNETFLGGS